MHNDQDKPSGALGWLAILAVVLAYDLYAIKTGKIESLTRAHWRWRTHPLGRLAVGLTWVVVSYHLIIESKFTLSPEPILLPT